MTVTNANGQSRTFRTRSNPILADTDGDGLSDARERDELHTASDLADTDGDGVNDREEVADGTDPLDARDFKCRPHLFRFDITSINQPDVFEGDYYWNGGSETQSTSVKCSVTIQRPYGAQVGGCAPSLVFRVTGSTGFSQCRGAGGTESGGCQVTSCPNPAPGSGGFCSAQGLPVPPTCPFCAQLGGRSAASASYFVQCD